MSLFDRLFRRQPPVTLEHPLFGRLQYSKHDGWQNDSFALWGSNGVELLIEADLNGPTRKQEDAFVAMRDAQNELLARCLAEVEKVRKEIGVPEGCFRISGLSIPSLQDEPHGRLWTLWFDLEGDDHYM